MFRFGAEWEREASTRLRAKQADVAGACEQPGRLNETTTGHAFDDIAAAWHADNAAGASSIIVADNASDTAEISARCQQLLRFDELLGERVVDECADGNSVACRRSDPDTTQHQRT